MTERHRFDRHGNRQLNAAFHRIALTQARVHPGARACLARKRAEGKSGAEALRCLKRLLVGRSGDTSSLRWATGLPPQISIY